MQVLTRAQIEETLSRLDTALGRRGVRAELLLVGGAFIPSGGTFERWRSLPHLDVSVADERTLLAMKCAAARTAEDATDIRTLAERLGLNTPAAILDVVTAIYPADRSPVRARLLVEELFA